MILRLRGGKRNEDENQKRKRTPEEQGACKKARVDTVTPNSSGETSQLGAMINNCSLVLPPDCVHMASPPSEPPVAAEPAVSKELH